MNAPANHPIKHPAECQVCIDAVLSSLAFRYREAIDPILDLKLDTSRKTNPGACVQTYFWLVERLPCAARAELAQIRHWLEGLIEVVAFRPNRELFSRRSLKLEAESLEAYCTGVIQQFRRLTAQKGFDVELNFAFRE